MIPAYDEATVRQQLGAVFSAYGIDGAGSFIGLAAGAIVAVAPDGRSIRHRVGVPFAVRWGVFPDRKRERWFVKGMDHYTITRVRPDGTVETLMEDGTWAKNKSGKEGRWLRSPGRSRLDVGLAPAGRALYRMEFPWLPTAIPGHLAWRGSTMKEHAHIAAFVVAFGALVVTPMSLAREQPRPCRLHWQSQSRRRIGRNTFHAQPGRPRPSCG